jgi:hypothetical protein
MTDHHDDDVHDDLARLLAEPLLWTDPPASLEDSVVAAVVNETATDPPRRGDRGRPRAFTLIGSVAAAVVGIVVVAAVTLLVTSLGDGDDHLVVALEGTALAPDARGQATVSDTPAGTKIVLDASELPPAPAGQYYQGWVRSGDEPVSIGTFHLRGGAGPIELWCGAEWSTYQALTVTLQDEGAGPESSGRVVLSGSFAGDG